MLPASNVGDSWETAGDKSEEGGDDVKSSCPLRLGLHTCYIGRYKGLQTREGERIPKSRSRFGLEAETRLHEAGNTRSRWPNPQGREPSKVGSVTGVKS